MSFDVLARESSFPFDCFAGGLSYIADDFDAPMDDFRECRYSS